MGRRRARACSSSGSATASTLTLGVDLDGELATYRATRLADDSRRARATSTSSASRPATTSPPIAWRATTIDAAGYATLDVDAGRVTATLGVRASTRWLLDASRLTPRVGTTPGIGEPADPVHRRSARARCSSRVTDDLGVRADGGRYHQARAASDASAVFGTPDLGLEQAWHVDRRRPVAARAVRARGRRLRALARRSRRARSRGHAAARAGAHPGRHRRRARRCSSPRACVGWHGLSGWLSYSLSRSRARTPTDQAWRLLRSRSDARPHRGRRLGARPVDARRPRPRRDRRAAHRR